MDQAQHRREEEVNFSNTASKPFKNGRERSAIYREERIKRGTQEEIAQKLGLKFLTISRRETGAVRITDENFLALLALPLSKKTKTKLLTKKK
jgi:transcriptional regulator with XRE-family HTH domain